MTPLGLIEWMEAETAYEFNQSLRDECFSTHPAHGQPATSSGGLTELSYKNAGRAANTTGADD